MSILVAGGGGGSGGNKTDNGTNPHWSGVGGAGGGIIVAYARDVDIDGSVNANGQNGGTGKRTGGANGGGGAGGSILLVTSQADIGSGLTTAQGGQGGRYDDGDQYGGNGGAGRIRIEYCDSLTGTSNPGAITQKLTCHITEQTETAPYTQGRLNIPTAISEETSYAIQYARRLVYTAAEGQPSTLRIPAGVFNSATLHALVSGVGSGDVTFKLDVGNDGTWDWETTQNVSNTHDFEISSLATAFNAYWTTHDAPSSGTVDVPVRVYLSKPGQVLLTDLRMAGGGSSLRYVRLPALAGGYSTVALDLNVGGTGLGPLTLAADVGDDGIVDWSTSGDGPFPRNLTTGDLSAAVNAYLLGKSGDVDVPVRFTYSPFGGLNITRAATTAATQPDGAITNADVSLTQTNLTEGDTTTINATVRSAGPAPLEDVTVTFFASLPNGFDWYLGSKYLPTVSPSGTTTSLVWDTTGFTGNTSVKAIVDPYNTLGETNENNNIGSKSATIKTRANLRPTAITPATYAPVAGEALTVDVTFQNNGQTASAAATCSLYLGNPDAGGTLIGSQACGALGANTSVTLTYNWTPGAAGEERLFARADSGNVLNEPDEFDNDRWIDLEVSDPGPQPPNQPSNPSPADNAINVPVTTLLSWTGGDPNAGNTVTYKVYMDSFNPPTTLKITQSATSYDPPGDLAQGTTYYWKIEATDNTNRTTVGPVWRFTTTPPPSNNPPSAPSSPNPTNGATGVGTTTQICWTASTDPDSDPVTYDVAFGTANPPSTVATGQSGTCHTPGSLTGNTTYYWKVTAKDNRGGSAPGPMWSFTTAGPTNNPPNAPANPNPATGATNIAIAAALFWSASDPDSDPLTYEVRFGTSNPPPQVVASQSAASYDPPGNLANNTTYYWQIVAKDATHPSGTAGTVWSFTTTNGGNPSITLPAVADAYTSLANPATNYGTATTLRVKEGSLPFNTYLKFDTSALGCAEVESATLRLFVTSSSAIANSVYAVTDNNWTEMGINWNNDPAISGISLDTSASSPLNTWVEYDVTAGVNLGGPVSFIITGNGSDVVFYSSREGSQPPQLVIQYTTSGGTTPTAAFSGSPLSGQAPLTVNFNNASTGCPTSYEWEFGDGGISTVTNPSHTYNTPGTYVVSLTAFNDQGDNNETKPAYVTVTPPPASPSLYVTPTKNGTVGGIAVTTADILYRDGAAGTWSMYFDGSDVGVTKAINAFARLPNGDLLLVFKANQVTSAGTFTPWDVARFTPGSFGPNTSGTFAWHFDGSDVDLAAAAEKIDALDALPDGRLLISTTGAFSVPITSGTLKAQDEDLVAFTPTSLGINTSGTWSTYFDGTSPSIPGLKSEDISGAHIDPTTGDIYATIVGPFTIGGISGNDKDVIKIHRNGTGSYTVTLYWRGPDNGFNLIVGGVELP